MHPSRRRKKRPNYGIRTVEVLRGPNGFGFTISGQQPCILSCIVANSPADQAGLRAGDFLISVNGLSVSKSTHDSVVNLIGNSIGPIKMTIAENYYSDSSDEEVALEHIANIRKPKYMQRPRAHRTVKSEVMGTQSPVKKTMRVQAFSPKVCVPPQHYDPDHILPPEAEPCPIECKALVGYLGTIEMPKQLLPNSRLQTVCSCIRKLRQEKRTPTLVLITVLPSCLTLKNATNQILAIYPTNRVVYISSSNDRDSRHFGLVTSAICDNVTEVYNSCHVFATDPKLVEHQAHAHQADLFQIVCTPDIITGCCLEFPKSALYVVGLVQTMYKLQQAEEANGGARAPYEDVVANSPQPSASSNSDSGIGFRDDCGNISDRILVVEFPAQAHVPLVGAQKRPVAIDALADVDDDVGGARGHAERGSDKENVAGDVNNIRAYDRESKAKEEVGRLTVRAMPDRVVGGNDEEMAGKSYETISISSFQADGSDFKSSVDNVSMHSARSMDVSVFKTPCAKLERRKKGRKMVASAHDLLNGRDEDGDDDGAARDYKLSPQVYGLSKPGTTNGSCDALTTLDTLDKCAYGSLQELSSWPAQVAAATTTRCNLVAQSEPDVRLQRRKKELCDDHGMARSADGPGAWASGFEKLLEDPVGLQAFAEFLKKEFSAENIYFWTACERYRHLAAGAQRADEARRIHQQHLCVGAPEPVNVDSQARQCAETQLHEAAATLFEPAQKQILNLMKFDSYPRFLKSDLYKQCLAGNLCTQFDVNLLLQPTTPTTNNNSNKLKKSLSNAEDRRRKSLLPWHRKNRSKSKDRGEIEYGQRRVDEDCDLHSSKSSLISQESSKGLHEDLAGKGPLCRVILCNGSTTVVQIRSNETVEQMVVRVLEKRGLTYSSFEVSTDKHLKVVSVTESATILTACEVKIEQRVMFKLDLPNRKVIAVKSKYTKMIADVLKPILNKYNYNLDQVMVTIGGKDAIDIMQPVTSIDGIRLNIQLIEEVKKAAVKVPMANLDEITNKVFKELLHEKGDTNCKAASDRASLKSEDWGSEHSSGIFGRFLRRDSGVHEKKKKVACVRTRGNSAHNSAEDISETSSGTSKKLLIAKWKSGVHKLHVGNNESDELYEGLKRAQRSRLEDQRGTEINFELPDFLKDRENNQCANRLRKIRRRTDIVDAKSRDMESTGSQFNSVPSMASRCNYENRHVIPAPDTTHHRHHHPTTTPTTDPNKMSADECSNASSPSSPSKDTFDTTLTDTTSKEDSPKAGEPPPLPPKPKVFPVRPSNWGPNHVFKVPRPPRPDSATQSLYLEQPTSSFV